MNAARRSISFVVPGRLDTRTGGYEYDRRMIEGLRDRGWAVALRELDGSFPQPTSAALAAAERALEAIDDLTIVLIDGLASGAMPDAIERHASRLSIVPVLHSLLAAEIGLDNDIARQLETGERRALAAARLIVVAGTALIEPLARYGVDRDRIAIVEPGADPAPITRGSRQGSVLHLVTVATLNPGKGHDVLLRALSTLGDRGWRLTCAGSTTRYPDTTARLQSMLTDLGMTGRVRLTGELDAQAIAALYDEADLFVFPTLAETHPLVVSEALARGLPIVSTAVGAIPELVGHGAGAAGLLVPPGDIDALANALTRVMDEPCVRAQLAEGARRARARLPTWDAAAGRMADVLERLSR